MSGSGKKQKDKGPLWFECSKCIRKFTRQSVTKHHELDCGIIYPFMEGSALFVQMNRVNKNSPAEILRLPFINNNRHASGIIFISHNLIVECGLEAFGWVTVTVIGKDEDRKLVELDASKGYAMIVWPIFEPSANQPYMTLMTVNGFKINSNLGHKIDDVCCVKIQRLNYSISLPIFSSASEVTVELDEVAVNGVNFDLERFIQTVKEFLLGRIVAINNKFQVRICTEMIPIIFTDINHRQKTSPVKTGSVLDLETTELTNKISSLQIQESKEQVIADFYEITEKTVINVIIGNDLSEPTDFVRLCDVGGLNTIISDIQSTMEFFLAAKPAGGEIPKGLMFHGHTGTGKSLLIKALCTYYSLHAIYFDGLANNRTEKRSSCRNSLARAVNEAVLRGPSAVIIENIDTYNMKRQSGSQQDQNVNFANALQSCVESLSSTSNVMLFATTSDIDSVDADLRSHRIFAKEIEITIPSAPDREDILIKLLKNVNHSLKSEDIKSIADTTHGFVGADLKGLCSQATMHAVQNQISNPDKCHSAFVDLKDFQECFKWVKPSAMRSILVDVPNVRWSDIGGQEDLKFKLKQAIEWPLKHPEAFQRLGIKPPKGILMYGPPGCSKTMIAKAIATESGLNFISVKGSELFSKWVGESEKAVQALFRKARQVSPSVIFFDEIDSLGGERGSSSGSSNVHERVLAQLLVEIDGIVPLKDVTIVAATNRPDIIDPALLRPGRLDRIIYVPMPDKETREDILKVQFRKMPVDCNVNLKNLVLLTDGYSGAEVTAVCHEAALKALEENIEATSISDKHFLFALEIVRPRIGAEQIAFYEDYYKNRKM